MANTRLKELVKDHSKKSANFWKGKPKATKQDLEAIDQFAKKKTTIIEKIFDTPEKIARANELLGRV